MKYIFLTIVLALFSANLFASGDRELSSAYTAKTSDVQVAGSGVVFVSANYDS